MGVEVPTDLKAAVTWLGAAAAAAHEELQDPQLKSFEPTGRLTFQKLLETVEK